MLKSLIDLVAHLEGLAADARPNDATDILGTGSECLVHCCQGTHADAGDGASPTSMDGCNGVVDIVEKE